MTFEQEFDLAGHERSAVAEPGPSSGEIASRSFTANNQPSSMVAAEFRKPTVETVKAAKILIVDDEPINVKIVRRYLQTVGYSNILTVTESERARDLIVSELPDLVLLDIMMPKVNGFEILQAIRDDNRTQFIPVIFLTAVDDSETKVRALELGGADFLAKPVDRSELRARITNTLLVKAHQDQIENYSAQLEYEVRLRTAELAASRQEAIHCLARAAEYRDEQTGHHVIRVGRYAAILGEELGFNPDQVALLEQAAQLHDVGKIGIPDAILRKPGKLDADEYEQMRQHCGFGTRILKISAANSARGFARGHANLANELLDDFTSPVMRLAARVAQTHHEKWDGSGYPLGLSGEDIPIEGRITAVADVFDALSSKRPYKDAYPRDKCFDIMKAERGKHFDPDVLDAFFARKADVIQVQLDFADLV
jgi:putative two-component system response regulator